MSKAIQGSIYSEAHEWIDEFKQEGPGTLFEWNKHRVEEFRSVSVETLLMDDYFLGLKNSIFEGVAEDIINLFEERKKRDLNLAIFLEAIGCVTGNTWVYTFEGPKKIQDVCKTNRVGEHAWREEISILTPTGFKKTSHFKKTGLEKTKKVQTRFGYEIEGTLDHPLEVLEKGEIKSKQMKDLNIGDYVAIDISEKPFGKNTELTSDLGYLIGYILGDGHINKYGFVATTQPKDLEIFDKLEIILKKEFGDTYFIKEKKDGNFTLRARGEKLREFLRKYDLIHLTPQKVVPEIIFKSPKEVVKAFLQGYFDADGSFSKNKFSISAKNKDLLKGIQDLLLLFGVISRIALKNCSYQGGKTTCWRLQVSGELLHIFGKEVGFNLKRKNEALNFYLSKNIKHNTNYRILPNILPITKEIVKEADKVNYPRYKLFKTYLSGNQNFSYDRSKLFLEHYQSTKNKEALNSLQEIVDYSENLVWLPIEIIEDSESVCYDFTIPETGNFLANGFASKNSGKTFKASVITWLLWYELSMHEHPQTFYNLAPNSIIALMVMSRSQTQAKRITFGDVWLRFQSQFNKDYFPVNPKFSNEIRISRNNTCVYAGTSSALSILGYNVYAATIDEANFLEVIDDSKKAIEEVYDAAEEMYNAVMNRMTSRFMKGGKIPGLLTMISSPRYPESFLERRIRRAKAEGVENLGMFWRARSLWEAKGKKFFPSNKYFVVDTKTMKILKENVDG